MHQYDRTVCNIIKNCVYQTVNIFSFIPVFWINGPQDHRSCNHRSYCIINISVRGTYNSGSMPHQIVQQLICLSNLIGYFFSRKSRQICVIIRMVAQFASQGFHTCNIFRIVIYHISNQEESGFSIVCFQTVKKPGGIITGTIVKGKSYLFVRNWCGCRNWCILRKCLYICAVLCYRCSCICSSIWCGSLVSACICCCRICIRACVCFLRIRVYVVK